ncbi:glycosyl hydrolase family 28-related protein [Gracilibacillus phocaeensis]|uniref:glycosyl hydrolase family 28-related protein n=1 Tax=Gracilibacillus phocaeensis TaxID=2042304 RepID=UPI001030442B|nr:glycosyl hydrolase family 28-related protein [Gracilibacillus phocaeensis]
MSKRLSIVYAVLVFCFVLAIQSVFLTNVSSANGKKDLTNNDLNSKENVSSLTVPSPRVMNTTLDSNDIPIASLDVTDFQAIANDNNDDTVAFQQALDTMAAAGGGVVFAPEGQYKFTGNLTIPEGVTLRGEWNNPDDGGLGKGTILMAYDGRNDVNGTPFISTKHEATLRDVTIWYPEQDNIQDIHPYPWTVANDSTDGYYGPNLVNITFINAYQGIDINNGSAAHFIKNVYGTFLKKGMAIDEIYDIGRLQTISMKPSYWADSPLGTPPDETSIRSYTRTHATGVVLYRSDWEYIYDVYMDGYEIGMHFTNSSEGSFNGQIWGVHTENGKIGMQFNKVNDNGVAISASTLNTTGTDGISVLGTTDFQSSVSFNSSTFGSPDGQPILLESDGLFTFSQNTFTDWDSGKHAIRATTGSIVATGNTFEVNKPDMHFENAVRSASVLGNTFDGNTPAITNISSNGDIRIDTTTHVTLPKMTNLGPDREEIRKPSQTNLYNVKDYGAVGDGTTDDSTSFQNALDQADTAGGGTVYVPAGRYKIDSHLTVGTNVELRGTWDGPHHYGVNKGSILVASENEGNPNGDSFISLSDDAGVRGLSVFYPNQHYDAIKSYPPTIATNGEGAYVIDVTLPNSYTGIELTEGDYHISYVRGLGLNKFIEISDVNTDGYIENIMNTVGDWQDGHRESNAPPTDWWLTTPSTLATGVEINDSSNIHLFNNFTFGVGYGLIVNGTSSSIKSYGWGSDNAEKALQLNGSGTEIEFVNTQLVAIGGNDKRYIYTPPEFVGNASFFNTLTWAGTEGTEINGSGYVVFQQYQDLTGVFIQNGGTMLMDSSFFHHAPDQITLGANIDNSAIYANVGFNGLGVNNIKGDPDVWMNIRR